MDPNVRKVLDQYNLTPQHLKSPQEERESLLQFTTIHGGKPPSIRRVEDIQIQINNIQFNIRIFTPKVCDELLPCMVYFPLGGWIRAGVSTHDTLGRHLANMAECVVILPEIRLAPENKFPTPLNDAMDIYNWVLENYQMLGINPQKIGLGGDSCGGNIAAALTNILCKQQVIQPIFQLLIYPPLNLLCNTPSYKQYETGYFATYERMTGYVNLYLNSNEEALDPRASPIFENNLHNLPKTHIVTAGYDPVKDECEEYYHKLLQANVAATYKCYNDFIHVFALMTSIPSVKIAIKEIAEQTHHALWD